MHQKTVLITGATSGIGYATARLLAGLGYRLIITGRNGERLQEIASSLNEQTPVYFLKFDVSDRISTEQALASIPSHFQPIDILINNAGNAYGLDAFQNGNPDDWEKMIDINLKGLLWVSRIIAKQMTERRSGHILHIASLAGRETYPGGNVYCASKHAVLSLAESMRKDLYSYGIRVGAISPGLVESNFSKVRFHGDENRAAVVYEGYRPLKPEDVANCIAFVISQPEHVNIGDMLVLPTDQASSGIVNKKH